MFCMNCRIETIYPGSISNLWLKVQNISKNHNVEITGSEEGGTFTFTAVGGLFKGAYKVNGQKVEINIHKKPFIIPCVMIRNFVTDNIGNL